MKPTKQITIELPEELHDAVRRRANALGLSYADLVRHLLAAWLAGEIEVPEQPEQPAVEV